MKNLILIIIVIFLFSGCENQVIREGRASIKSYLHKTLNDPKSLDVLSEKFILSKNKMTVYWTIDYTAKNRFGGVDRNKEYFITFGKDYVRKLDTEVEFSRYVESDDLVNGKSYKVYYKGDTSAQTEYMADTAQIESMVDTTE